MSDKLADRKFWKTLRAGLAALGVKTADAETFAESLEAHVTGDESPELLIMRQQLSTMDGSLKAIMARLDARDAAEAVSAEEEAKLAAEAARKKAAEDEVNLAAEGAARKAAEDEAAAAAAGMEEEETGDTVLEAEVIGNVINLGKTWCGTAVTGDSISQEPVLQAVLARAEILAPGLTGQPTTDSIKGNKGVKLAAFMRAALEAHATADAVGAANVKTFLLGKKIGDLRGANLVGVFNGVAQLARVRNNQQSVRGIVQRGRHTGDFSRPKTGEQINTENAKFWAAK